MTNKVNLLETPKQFQSEAERHAWHRQFSVQVDTMDDVRSPEEQEKARSYLQGWLPNSGIPETYIRPKT